MYIGKRFFFGCHIIFYVFGLCCVDVSIQCILYIFYYYYCISYCVSVALTIFLLKLISFLVPPVVVVVVVVVVVAFVVENNNDICEFWMNFFWLLKRKK